MLHDVLNGVYLEDIVDALHCTGKSFKSHTRINILALHFSIVSVSVAVELAENKIPYLNYTVDLTCLLKTLKRAIFLASVEVDLGAWTAWT